MAKTKSSNQLTDWKQFSIAKPILRSLREQKLVEPLPIQIRALKAAILEDKHVLGAARTGSGKTLAYAIPVLNRILLDEDCSTRLKRKMSKSLSKREDFELIDNEMVEVEDMIVDNIENQEKDISKTDDCLLDEVSSVSGCDDDDDNESVTISGERTAPNAIILVPTRELAVQVKSEFDKLCSSYTTIKCCCIIGGISQDKQLRTVQKLKPHIIIATPGRLYDIVQSESSKFLDPQGIASIQSLVIDEADRMVQKGHFEEMLKLTDMVKESKNFRRNENPFRVYLFSATLTFLHEIPERFKKSAMLPKTTSKSKNTKEKKVLNPNEHTKKNKIRRILTLFGIQRDETRIIDLNDGSACGRPSSEQLTEMRINCLSKEKDLYLYYYLCQNSNSRTLVFCNSKDCLRRLSNVFKYLGYETLKLHSEMDQKKRLSNLERFRKQSNSVLIATDVAARGLDIKELDNIVHYQVPRTCESYIHRSGRTARVFRKGTSLTLCEPKEAPLYRRLCNNINEGKDLDDYDIDSNLKALLKTRVALAQQCDKLDHKLRETKSNRNWFVNAAKECDIELDDDYLSELGGKGKSKQENLEDDATDRRSLNKLQKQLNSLLKKPLITKRELMANSAKKLNLDASQQAII